MNDKKRGELILWGFHKAHGNVPMKLESYSNQAKMRREREGWTCSGYREGDAPTGLQIEANIVRQTCL